MPNDPASVTTTHEAYDEYSGVYGFFRRHQKKLLYTAGLFTLLTFSVTAPMTAAVSNLFSSSKPRGTIVVNGATVELEDKDFEVGQQLHLLQERRAIPFAVLPPVGYSATGDSERPSVLALLRRAALAEGFAASMTEVDRAIDSYRQLVNIESPQRLASEFGMPSLAAYRQQMAEAMLIGNYVKLQLLALDDTDARVLSVALEDRDKIGLKVATFDQKKLKEELEAAGKLTDDELRKWFEDKEDREKQTMQAYDLPKAQLNIGALLLAEGQFAPEQWKDGPLKDFTITDDQLRGTYEQQKDTRFKKEDGTLRGFDDDPTVKAELTRHAQAVQVMNSVLTTVQEQLNAALKPLNDELVRTQTEQATRNTAASEMTAAKAAKDAELAKKRTELAEKPDDAALKAEVAALEEQMRKAADDVVTSNEALEAAKAAVTVAQDAVKDARAKFDFLGAFATATKDKQGFVVRTTSGMKNAEELKDLEGNDLGLGQWPDASKAMTFANKGDVSSMVHTTTKAVMLCQAADLEQRPLKPWDKLKPLVQGAYYTDQAQKQGEEKQKQMEEVLLRLAKAKIPEKVAEIEAKRQARIDEKVTAWEKQMQADLADAETWLAKPNLGDLPRAEYTRKRDNRKTQLANKAQRVKDFEAEVAKAIDHEIGEEAKKVHGEVLEAAAAEAGFTIRDIAPLPRDLASRPRFDVSFDPTIAFLFRQHSKLKQGESTGVVQDRTNSRFHVAVCTKVEPLQAQDLTRREFAARKNPGGGTFAMAQAMGAYTQAFSMEALEARYQWKPAVGTQVVEPPVGDGAGK